MNKTLNTRYLLRILAILAVILVATWLVHRRQASKQLDAFLHQAELAKQEQKPDREIGYLRRYLVMKPNDTDTRARLALLLAENARTKQEHSQAFLEMEEVLRQDGNRDDIRRREIPLMMKLGMMEEAKGRLKQLIEKNEKNKKNKTDGTLHDLMGQCLMANHEYGEAVNAFDQATERDQKLILAYGRWAFLLRERMSKPDEADNTIDKMVCNNAESTAAHLLAANYWKEAGNQKKYEEAVETAKSCDPEDLEVVLAVAGLAESRADGIAETDRLQSEKLIEDTCSLVRNAIDKHLPEAIAQTGSADREKRTRLSGLVTTLFVTLARFELRLGRVADAEKTARRAVESFTEFAEPRLKLAEICILKKNWDEAEQRLDELKEMKDFPAAMVNYNRGRIRMEQEQWCEASRLLEQAAAEIEKRSPLIRQIQFLLGTCYDRTGLLDRRLEAYRKARPQEKDKNWLRISMRIGGALVEMGRAAEAKSIYSEIATRYRDANIPWARLLLADVLGKKNPPPQDPQDFAAIEKLLNEAPKGVERELFRADLASARKKSPKEIRNALVNAQAVDANAIEPWAALAYFELRQENNVMEAEKILDDAKAKFGDRALFRLIRGRIATSVKLNQDEKALALAKLEEGSEELGKDDQRRLLRGLAEIAQAAGLQKTSDQFWEKLAAVWPDNLGVHLVRFDNARLANDEKRMEKATEDIARLDLDSGTSTRIARALHIIWKAKQKKDFADLDKAAAILTDLAVDRPDWGRIPLAQAVILDLKELNELKGPSVLSLPMYRRAFDLGERDPEVLRRLVEMYMAQGQTAEAAIVMRQWPEGRELGGVFQQVVAEVAVQSRDFKRALELAEKAVPENEKDFRKLIWLSRLQWTAGKGEAARKTLDRAIEMAPDRPEPWLSLVQYFTLQKQKVEAKAEAKKTIERMMSRINPVDKALALAESYEIIGELKTAGEHYQQALKDRPDDLKVLKNFAGLRLREGNGDAARELLYRILKNAKRTDEDEQFAKRLVTIILALNPDFEARREWLEKEKLLDPESLKGTESVEEIRNRAFALALQRDLPSRSEAIRLLQTLDSPTPLRREDKFLLAQLHAGVGDGKASRRVMAALLQLDAENALYITFYIGVLIREQQLSEAESWLTKLEAMESVPPRTFEMRARLYAAQRDIGKAAELLRSEAEKPEAEVARIAAIMEEVGAGAEAEPLYKRLMEASKRPEAPLILALYYGRQNRLTDALKMCDLAWGESKVNRETVCSGYVLVFYTVTNPRPDLIDQIAERLEEEWKKRKQSPTMLSNMAAMRNLQKRYTEAIAFYQNVLRLNAKDTIALNNLAYLLSASENKHGEALSELQKAINSIGRLPTLLDTQAQVYIAMGEPERAIKLLNEAIRLEPSGSLYFHLAQANHLKQQRCLKDGQAIDAKGAGTDAKIAWNEAQKLKLKKSDLHPLEQVKYEELKPKFQ